MAAKKLPDVQLRLAGGLRAALAQAYALQEVPTYILIGEDGYLLQFQAQTPEQPRRRGRNQPIFDEVATYLTTPELAAIKR